MTATLRINHGLALLPDLTQVEKSLFDKGFESIAGVDEAGRGPLAGPVVAAAVILPKNTVIRGLDDSKKLTPRRREELFDEIASCGASCAVGIIDNITIDRMNILKASLLAMRKAVMSLSRKPEFVLVDGNHTIPNLELPQIAIVSGDSLCASISAASIIAKVTRDRIMDKYEEIYPEFSFSVHRGYPTPQHLSELKTHGPTEIHRKSFRPVEESIPVTRGGK
ncbi:MAG: ribonuclease HII [bacterium]|jgi:ribonuclease HII